MKPVRLGIIGCGIAARELHWPALKEMKDRFEIRMVCNHTKAKAQTFAGMVGGVPFVTDYHELLASEDIDAVSIILPFELNRQVTEDALKAGKHVMIEKPIAGSMFDAESMLRLEVKYRNCIMMVAENYRYRPLYHRVKEMLNGYSVGRLYGVIWNFFTDVASEANEQYMETKWRIDHSYPGGFLTDGGVHIIAVLHDLFGEITSASALTESVNERAGKVDTMNSQFTTSNGPICSVNQFYSAKGLRVNSIHLFGDMGTIIVDNYTSTITLKRSDEDDIVETTDEDRGYVGEYDDFYLAIHTGRPVTSTFEKAYRDFKVIVGALESAETGEVVLFK
ncbi:Gfo/Idh/MocA family protein [Candidatus Latescibacterota bacterium]